MRPHALLAAAVLALGLVLGLAAPAKAATYVVRSCDNGSLSGWSSPPYRPLGSSCGGPGGALYARFDGAAGDALIWRFSAPADTEISGFTIARGWWLNATVPFGSPVYALQTFGAGARYANIRANLSYAQAGDAWGTETASGLTGQGTLDVSVNCGGGAECRHPAASFDVYSARIALRDTRDPVIGTVSGTLAGGGQLTGTRSLHFSASDRGGGVLRAELLVDGAVAQSAGIGACEPDAGGAFAEVVPCKLVASGAFALDTVALADGPHAVGLRVYDATGANADTWTRTVEVANRPADRPPPPAPAPPAPVATPAGPGPAAAPAAAAARPARLTAWLELAHRRLRRVSVSYGTRVRIRGVLTAADGTPIAHAPIRVIETVAGRRPVAITGLRTRADGRLTTFARVGPSRTLRLAYENARGPRLGVVVRAAVRLRAVRRGAWLALTGALRGGALPPGGVLVAIEALRGGRWTALTNLRSGWAGRFHARVPDGAPPRAGAPDRVRATVPWQPGYPFAAGSGPAVEVLE